MVTVTIPTKGRPERLSACLKSIDYKDVQVRIGANSVKDIEPCSGPQFGVVFVRIVDGFPVPVQNELAGASFRGSNILPISDDVCFHEGAIQKAVDCLTLEFPDYDGVVGFDIINMEEKHKSPYAYMLIGSKFFERLGRTLFHDGYKHFYADSELGEYAESLGRFRLCKQARLEHYHPCTGARADHTHTADRQNKWNADFSLYNERKSKWLQTGYANFAESLRTTLQVA